jgi:hypothetical protein
MEELKLNLKKFERLIRIFEMTYLSYTEKLDEQVAE